MRTAFFYGAVQLAGVAGLWNWLWNQTCSWLQRVLTTTGL